MRRLYGSAVVVTLALALTGCGGDNKPKADTPAPNRPAAEAQASDEPLEGVTRNPSADPEEITTGEPAPDPHPTNKNPTANPTSTVRPIQVTVTRSGGVAGVDDRLVVKTDASWTYTSKRQGTKTGKLSKDVANRLFTLARDPRLAQEAKAGGGGGIEDGPQTCPDMMTTILTVGNISVRMGQCTGDPPERPVTKQILNLLDTHTAW